ncbi:hypothetical protein HMPREF9135_1133 [Segatella baroniae F0067]|uniref:Uncharacterized protein n=1 Tax=Segatella baroniae F0067 TaxID=1115809 RepID=U2QCQ1_9BACT|nr:hypothetical protein HMPREF9135_1133 [Segatella baroniae F0067]
MRNVPLPLYNGRFGMKTCASNPNELTALELKICILNPK